MASAKPRVIAPEEQPEWGGQEPANAQLLANPDPFLKKLVTTNPAESIVNRGYCVFKLGAEIKKDYDEFYTALKAFSHTDDSEKLKFASTSDGRKFSANQYHGYSKMVGLKEQYMIRGAGPGFRLPLPGKNAITKGASEQSPHFGVCSLKLYEDLDQLCRVVLQEVAKLLQIKDTTEKILDPVDHDPKRGRNEVDVQQDDKGLSICTSPYFYPGYVSSSILDTFYYFNRFNKEDGSDINFKNNHAAHTDTGILTVVPCADTAGLEVYDQQDKTWVAIERIIHKVGNHRDYAIVFWGESYQYFAPDHVEPCLHRVERCTSERYSIVYKMRTHPLHTQPRYQEDYDLGLIQLKAMENAKGPEYTKSIAIFNQPKNNTNTPNQNPQIEAGLLSKMASWHLPLLAIIVGVVGYSLYQRYN